MNYGQAPPSQEDFAQIGAWATPQATNFTLCPNHAGLVEKILKNSQVHVTNTSFQRFLVDDSITHGHLTQDEFSALLDCQLCVNVRDHLLMHFD